MAKRKKTKEQKLLAEMRRKQQVVSADTYTYSFDKKEHDQVETATASATVITKKPLDSFSDSFLYIDLRKTLIATVLIVIIEFILHRFLI